MARLRETYGLSEAQAHFVCEERETAEFFERVVELGGAADAVAPWLMGDVQKHLNRTGVKLADSPLTAERLASVLHMLDGGRIHGKIAKQVVQAVFDDDADPERIIVDRGWEQLTDRAAIRTSVREVLASAEQAVAQIRAGETRPRTYLVGEVMKKTAGRADPRLVQEILNDELELEFVQVIAFGGAISGSRRADGMIVGGDPGQLVEQLRNDPGLPGNLRYQELTLGEFLSEEVTPTDWAGLVAAVARHLREQQTSGIVISHGTDTLSYTASLLHWLFGVCRIPVVLTASSLPSDSVEARENLSRAVRLALDENEGIHVVFAGESLPPVNLRFERIPTGGSTNAFRTWNPQPAPASDLASIDVFDMEPGEIARRLEGAVRRTHIVKMFPGMQSSSLIALMNAGVKYFVLELYDTGTASVRESPFSIREALHQGQDMGVVFFCTSQQEGNVDFSEYVTGHELWREGAIPMGRLTTESAYTRLLAVQLTSDPEDTSQIIGRMEY
jgi:aspartyl-tRNA(Asn)/glutamyl-tRNA(Gln) amidotransferase subunit B